MNNNSNTKKYKDFEYKRPDMVFIKEFYESLNNRVDNVKHEEDMKSILHEWNKQRIDYKTNASLISVRFTQNVKDEWAKSEKKYIDETSPLVGEWKTNFMRKVLESNYVDAIKKEWGDVLLLRMEQGVKTFVPELKPLLIEQSELIKQYDEIIASAEIEFQGETHNLSSLGKKSVDPDRNVRLAAQQAKYNFLEKNSDAIETIFDKLVHLCDDTAKKAGFENYIEYRYVQMGRSEYGPEDVKNFRNAVHKNIVPFLENLYEEQRKRLNVDELYFHDEPLMYPEGNPVAQGNPEWIVARAKEMYAELSPETDEFFTMMIDRDLMDLVNRPNKSVGGYCTNFPTYGVPFIFSNFNGTTHDIEVLTHEAGHAFQVWESRHYTTPEYYFPTLEACEIHSMSMEYLTWNWMEKFFGNWTNRFKYSHVTKSMMFMAYGCAVDEFQHWIYENVSATPAERNKQWKKTEEKYLPWRKYDNMPHTEKGTMWQFQKHIFGSPFYYIDYVLAQTCAIQFWARSQEDFKRTFADYLAVCKVGGSKTFLEIVKTGNLLSPFDSESIKFISERTKKWLGEWRDDFYSDRVENTMATS